MKEAVKMKTEGNDSEWTFLIDLLLCVVKIRLAGQKGNLMGQGYYVSSLRYSTGACVPLSQWDTGSEVPTPACP